jgi:serine/threonine protein kinase
MSSTPAEPHRRIQSAGDSADQPQAACKESAADPLASSDSCEVYASTRTFNGEQKSTRSADEQPTNIATRYRVLSLLGRGGFGTVYEAWDEVLERTVALKLAHLNQFGNERACNEFLEEARSAAKLRHPHIVAVHDSGSDEDGRQYVVFDYVPGNTLSGMRKQHRLGHDEVAQLLGVRSG